MSSAAEQSKKNRDFQGLWVFGAVLLVALLLRLPSLSSGLPYFYMEDEAHHFNRVAEMVKTGDYNPHYFLKPSLHFYMRMPVLALSFLWNVREGHLRKLEDVKTRDSFGIAGYAFSASHPGLVKWNRAFSLVFALFSLILLFAILSELRAPPIAKTLAGLLLAVSPAHVEYSAVIGVDVFMMFFALLSSYLALRAQREHTFWLLVFSAISAGLAVSSKYNAAPIIFVPLLGWFFADRGNWRLLFAVLLVPVISFFVGTPYALLSLPLFLDHIAYEIWHYGVATHVGHTASPGVDQALFYLGYLQKKALGIPALWFSVIGFFVLIRRLPRDCVLLALYPVLFFILMALQRTNFERNMLSLIPFAALFAGYGIHALLEMLTVRPTARKVMHFLAGVVLLLHPLALSLQMNREKTAIEESRLAAEEWLRVSQNTHTPTVVGGELQFPLPLFSLSFIERAAIEESTPEELYQKGFRRVVAGSEFSRAHEDDKRLDFVRLFTGITQRQRIVQNPQIMVFDLPRKHLLTTVPEELIPPLSLTESNEEGEEFGVFRPVCDGGEERYCWLSSRLNVLTFPEGLRSTMKGKKWRIHLELMSPWGEQSIRFATSKDALLDAQKSAFTSSPGSWEEIFFEISGVEERFFIELEKVLSPKDQGLNEDTRRLGVALQKVRIERL